MRKNRKLSWILTIAFVFSTIVSLPTFPVMAGCQDINGHWAKPQIEHLMAQKIINGYPDNTFKPENPISRAEFIVITNKAFNFNDSAAINYSDVKPTDWFAADIARAKAARYISGYEDGTMKPDQQISRQEAASIVARILALKSADTNATLQRFSDNETIANWSRDSIAAMVENGYLKGYPDNSFKPANSIKRAEAAVLFKIVLDRDQDDLQVEPKPEIQSLFDQAGTYGPKTGTQVINEDVTISASGVILQNIIIEKDLIIAKEVGDGDVTLNNVTVKGKTYVRGGGKDSIHINGGQYSEIIIEQTATGQARIVAVDTSGLRVTISENARGEEIILEGDFRIVTVNADDVNITTQGDTNIGEIRVQNGLQGVNIDLAEDSNVKEMVLNSKTNVEGQGTIEKASGSKASDSTFATQPGTIAKPSTSGGGGGGDGGSTTSQLNINPTSSSVNKNNVTDIPINITWGSATKITGITGSALGGAVKITLIEGKEYVVKDYGNGTGLLTIKKNITELLPVPITVVPDATVLTLTIKFDKGEKDFQITVVGGTSNVTRLTIKTPPTKVTYTAGEELSLTGLVVTLTKSDASSGGGFATTEDVAFKNFASKGISATPANGTVLATTDTKVTIAHTASGKSVDQGINVNAAFKEVTDITGVPTDGTQGVEVDLTGATVAPADATNKTIVWTVKDAGTTGVQTSDLTSGKFTPVTAGKLQLTATIDNGTAVGTDYKKDFTITVAAADPGITDISLAATPGLQVGNANVAANAEIGTLSVTGGTAVFTYALEDDSGTPANSADNALFSIAADKLKVASTGALIEARDYKVTVKVNDSKGKTFTKGFTVIVAAANVINTNQSKGYNTIQAAIDDATAGDTIVVGAGTYAEALSLDKSLTINGVDGTIITGGAIAATTGAGKTLTVSEIEFKTAGLEVDGYDDVTISNNKFTDITSWTSAQLAGNIANSIYVHGSSTGTALILNNTISGVRSDVTLVGDGMGIMVRDLDNITITGNTISDTYHNSINIYGGIAGGVTVTDNILSNWDSNKDTGESPITKGCEGGRAIRVDLAGASISAKGNTFTPNDNTTPVDPNYVKITGYAGNVNNLIYSLVNSNTWPSGAVYSTVILVNTTPGTNMAASITNGSTTNYYPTIQAAIDAATAEDTIIVGAGTYGEALSIDKSLTILGVNANNDARSSAFLDEGSIVTGGIRITAGDVTIKGLTIKTKGILASNIAGLTLVNNRIAEIGQAMADSPAGSIIGLDVMTLATGPIVINQNKFSDIGLIDGTGTAVRMVQAKDSITITDNIIENVTKNGINLYTNCLANENAKLTITGNEITDWDSDKDNNAIGGRAIRIDFAGANTTATADIIGNKLIPPIYPEGQTPIDSEYVKLTTVGIVVNLPNNYWGSASPAFGTILSVKGTKAADCAYVPYYTDEAMTTLANSVEPDVNFTFTGLDAVTAGTVDFTITTKVTNNGAIADNIPLRYKAVVTKDGFALADQVIKYPEATDVEWPNQYHTFTTDSIGTACFGPDPGFILADLPALLEAGGVTTPFQADFAAGEYSVTVSLLDISGGGEVVLGSGTKEFTVGYVATLGVEEPNTLVAGTAGYTRFAGSIDVTDTVKTGDFKAYYIFEITDGSLTENTVLQYWDYTASDWKNFADEGSGKYRFGDSSGFDLKAVDGAKTEFQANISGDSITAKAYLVDAVTKEIISNVVETTITK